MDKYEIYSKAIDTYGVDSQIDMAIEEMSELTKALLKERRKQKFGQDAKGVLENIAEEMADVRITLDQLNIIFENESLEYNFKQEKLKRLEERLKEVAHEN